MNTKIIRFILVFLAIQPAFSAYCSGEDFKGEKELVERLPLEQKSSYYGLQYLMNKFQKKQFLSLGTRREREEWISDFWIHKDPTPATEKNERRIEHRKRVELARKMFGMEKSPGWDKRGETLIRYGMPSVRTEIPSNIGFYKFTPPGELWYYRYLDMLIPFQNFNLNGIYIYAIERYGQTSRQTLDQLKAIVHFYTQSSTEDYMYTPSEQVMALAQFNPDEIDYVADPSVRSLIARDLIGAIEQEKIQKSKNNFHKYLKENPTIYSFEVNQTPLPVYFDITSYRDEGDLLECRVSFEIPSSEIRFMKKEGKLRAKVALRALVRDMGLKPRSEGKDSIIVIQDEGGEFEGPSYLPGQITLSLEPGYYRIGVEALDRNSGRRGSFNTNLLLEETGESLTMSDIAFATSIGKAQGRSKFNRGGLQIVPHPLHAYRIPFPLTFYFEIYNLDLSSDSLAYYSVDYKITPLGKRRKGPVLEEVPTAVYSRFESEGYGSKQEQRLEIATDNLWRGTFMLSVRVMDRRTRESVEKTGKFSILD